LSGRAAARRNCRTAARLREYRRLSFASQRISGIGDRRGRKWSILHNFGAAAGRERLQVPELTIG